MKVVMLSSVVILSLLANSLTVFCQTAAQGATETWETVKTVPVARELVVKLKDGKTVKGRQAGATDTGVTLSRKKSLLEIPRSSIRRVSIIIKNDRETAKWIGAGVGAVGLSLTALDGTGDANPAVVVLFLAALGAGMGYLIGSLFGLPHKTVLIYEANK